MDSEAIARAKRRAAESAVEVVSDGDTVGLGTGSTAAFAIDALGRAVDAGLTIEGVPTSYQARERARSAGIDLVSLQDLSAVDVAIDGADQVAGFDAIKGGGGAHVRERIVDAAADELHLVVDERKLAGVLSAAVPAEVLPSARSTVAAELETLGASVRVREAERKDGPVISENGNLILDCDFGGIEDPGDLATALSQIPGLVDHGLFVEMAAAVHIGGPDGVDVRRA